jgi:hypothetical protein
MMKRQLVNTIILAVILVSAFGLAGCGGNNRDMSVETADEAVPTDAPTEVVIPTEEPTEEIIPTEEPTQEALPTEAPTEEVIPTEEAVELPPILGTYSVTGVDPDHNNYEDTLEIMASNGILQWNWLNREPLGIGLVQEDVVSVAWGEEKECNVISFFVDEEMVLDGIYAEKGETRTGSDKSMPQGEMGEGIEGTYMAFGSTPGGGMYICDLEVTRNGDFYDFYWPDCGDSFYGVGIQRGNIVSVAFSRRNTNSCMLYSYLIEEDGTLNGLWATIGAAELGTDVATPETSD